LLLCLAPFAPHLSDELLQRLGFAESSYKIAWPVADESLAREDEITIPVQVNGKLRARVTVAAGSDDATIRTAALSHAEIAAQLGESEPKKVVVVPGRLVNIVI